MNIILNELIMFIKLYIEVKVMRIKMCFGLNNILGINIECYYGKSSFVKMLQMFIGIINGNYIILMSKI